MKIIVKDFGFIHYYAQCSSCEWDCGINTDKAPKAADVRKEIRKHILETGHTVNLDTGTSKEYGPELL